MTYLDELNEQFDGELTPGKASKAWEIFEQNMKGYKPPNKERVEFERILKTLNAQSELVVAEETLQRVVKLMQRLDVDELVISKGQRMFRISLKEL
jgi:hypothetical protein